MRTSRINEMRRRGYRLKGGAAGGCAPRLGALDLNPSLPEGCTMGSSPFRTPRTTSRAVAVVLLALLPALVSSCGGNDGKTGGSLILKTQTTPYFVAMKQSAQAEADQSGAHLSVATGNADGDTQ